MSEEENTTPRDAGVAESTPPLVQDAWGRWLWWLLSSAWRTGPRPATPKEMELLDRIAVLEKSSTDAEERHEREKATWNETRIRLQTELRKLEAEVEVARHEIALAAAVNARNLTRVEAETTKAAAEIAAATTPLPARQR